VPGTTFYTGPAQSIGATTDGSTEAEGSGAVTNCDIHDDPNDDQHAEGFCQTCAYDPRAALVAMLDDDSLHLDRAPRSRILDVIVDIDDHVRTS
jgi:hypothetical protein